VRTNALATGEENMLASSLLSSPVVLVVTLAIALSAFTGGGGSPAADYALAEISRPAVSECVR
jgi:hypothetical protein